MIAIKAEGLSKQYRLGEQAMLHKKAMNPFKKLATFWALDDISFELEQGHAMGIIGANGSGKSTLLKVLSRITAPTKGCAIINGKITSMLEVGTGFHSELTGRENIILNGVILGMKESEVRNKMDEIIDFSGIEKFIDTPVKRYSSGMYVRLAFAVAAHLDPEILLIDEVLSVGDAAFQKKSVAKMGESTKQGKTVLLVSHNMNAIKAICPLVMFLDKGKVARFGAFNEVVNRYLKESTADIFPKLIALNEKLNERGSMVEMKSIEIVTPHDTAEVEISQPITIRIAYKAKEHVALSLAFCDQTGGMIFNSLNNKEPNWYGKQIPEGEYISECTLPSNMLNEGVYSVFVYICIPGWSDGITTKHLYFKAIDDNVLRGDCYVAYSGIMRPALQWITHKAGAESLRESQEGGIP